jgi:hypothetical protein
VTKTSRRTVIGVGLGTLLALAGSASAADPPASAVAAPADGGAFLHLRTGYGVPYGSPGTASYLRIDLADVYPAVVPLQIDVGYGNGRTSWGGYFAVGFFQTTNCGRPCSATDYGVGFLIERRLSVHPTRRPWIQGAVGFEYLDSHAFVERGGGAGSVDPEYGWQLSLSGGFELRPRPLVGVGPFVTLSYGSFGTAVAGESYGVENGGHGWALIGLRLTVGR